MIESVNLQWTGDMSFEVDIDGHKIPLDTSVEAGGKNTGARPKKFMLLALAGCTAMDVMSLLKKMQVTVDEFAIDVQATLTEGEHPHVYEDFKIIYKFKGTGLDQHIDKINRAVNLSKEKYCGVSAMLIKIAPIAYEIEVY